MYRKLICLIGLMAVFAWSANALAAATLVDDFDSYNNGQVDACSNGNWMGMPGGFASAVIEADPANPANKVLRISAVSTDPQGAGTYGILSSSAQIADGVTKTLFLRFRVSNPAAVNQSFGLTNVNAPVAPGTGGNWTDFGPQIRVGDGGNLTVRDNVGVKILATTPNGAALTLTADTWYNLWVVVTNGTGATVGSDTLQVYLQGGSVTSQTLLNIALGTQNVFNFRTAVSDALDRFLWRAQPQAANPQLWVDDISIMDGTDLTYPSPSPVFTANNLLVNGDFEASGIIGSFGSNPNPNPYPSGWSGWGLNGSLHSDTGYRRDLMGVFLSWNDTGLFQDFAAVADRAYTISADVITPSSDPIKFWTGQISVEWYNELGGQIGSDIVGALTDTDPNNTWKTVKNTFFAPADAKIGSVVLMLGGSLVPNGLGGYLNSGKAYFDNVAVIGLEPDYNNDDMVKLDDFATACATWLGTSEITDLTGDSFFGPKDIACFAMKWFQPIPDYELVWSDEFDGTSVDTSKWVYDVGGGGWGNNELEYYTNGLNASVSGGNLIIEARSEYYWGRYFTSTRMKTKNKFSYLYGTVEIRANIPDLANGLWPALWTMGNTGGWPANGELDIMEMGSAAAIAAGEQNRRTGSAAHWEYNGNPADYSTPYYTAPSNLTGSFHIWKMDWTPTSIIVYLDGVQRWGFTISGGVASDLEEFHHSFYILMNLAVGGNYTGITDVSGITAPFPARMYIDYVRVYKKAK